MTPEGGQPTTREIEDQLQRMLASDRFRLADKQSPFFELVVRRALNGKKTPGHVIAKELFPDTVCKTPDGQLRIVGNHAREAAKNLRKTLKRYYAEEGRGDPVVISFLEPSEDRTVKLAEGEAYTPRFAYSAVHSLPREIRLGNHHHRRGTVEDDEIALQHYAKALDICPDHVEAAIGMIETWCELYRWGEASAEELRVALLPKAVHVLNAEWARGSKNWRLYAAAGFVYFLAGRNDQAAGYFGKARTLDRTRTESYEPYLLFLLYCGDRKEALSLSKLYLEAHEDDSRAYIPYLSALLKSRKYEKADAVLARALTIDRSDMLARYYMACLRVLQRRDEEALPHLGLLKLLTDHRSFGQIAKRLENQLGALPRDIRDYRLLAESAFE